MTQNLHAVVIAKALKLMQIQKFHVFAISLTPGISGEGRPSGVALFS
jgi:hypothetical protein